MITINKEKKAAADQVKLNVASKAYLASTDWYVTRKNETGQEIPQEILDKRSEARASIK